MEALRIETLTGAALRPHLPTLARLRTAVFRDFPYLYDGDPANEAEHLAEFAASARAALVVAFDRDEPVGCSTCLAAVDEAGLRAPLEARGADPETACYFGESVLLAPYRGRGAGVAFFERREAYARESGFALACFAAVRRAADHPRRPPDHVPLDKFWRNRGFAPWPGPPLEWSWRQVDGPDKVANALDFWVKRL